MGPSFSYTQGHSSAEPLELRELKERVKSWGCNNFATRTLVGSEKSEAYNAAVEELTQALNERASETTLAELQRLLVTVRHLSYDQYFWLSCDCNQARQALAYLEGFSFPHRKTVSTTLREESGVFAGVELAALSFASNTDGETGSVTSETFGGAAEADDGNSRAASPDNDGTGE